VRTHARASEHSLTATLRRLRSHPASHTPGGTDRGPTEPSPRCSAVQETVAARIRHREPHRSVAVSQPAPVSESASASATATVSASARGLGPVLASIWTWVSQKRTLKDCHHECFASSSARAALRATARAFEARVSALEWACEIRSRRRVSLQPQVETRSSTRVRSTPRTA